MFFLYSFAPKNKHFQWGNQNLSLTPWWSKLFWYHKVSGLTPLRALSHCVSVTHWMEIIVSLMSNMCQGIPSGSQLQLSAFKFGTPFDGNLYNDRASQSPRIRISDGENLWSAALSSKQLWSTLRLRRYWKINKRPLGIPPTVRRRNKCDLTKTQPTFFSERNWYWIPYRMGKKPCQGSHCQSLFKLLMWQIWSTTSITKNSLFYRTGKSQQIITRLCHSCKRNRTVE